MNKKYQVKYFSLRISKTAIGSKHMKYILCNAIFFYRIMYNKTLIKMLMIYGMITVNQKAWKLCNKMKSLINQVFKRSIIRITVNTVKTKNRSLKLVHYIFTWLP